LISFVVVCVIEKFPKLAAMEERDDAASPADIAAGVSTHSRSRRLHSAHSTGMESSIFRFKNVNFVVGTKDKEKHILKDVTGTVKWGHVLAVMGPSGAGTSVKRSAFWQYSLPHIFT
jgi:ABC-type transport system involved in cytochrome bd biosynthesis fused ATPase/permease subunit